MTVAKPPELLLGAASADPVVLGLERKLDVLRGQLEACQRGEDVGEAGIATWSRLEHQSQRIQALEAELAASRARCDMLQQERDAEPARAARQLAVDGEAAEERNRLRHEAALLGAELKRSREELAASQKAILKLGRQVLEETPQIIRAVAWHPQEPSALPAAPDPLLAAVLNSTCWRLTRPMRRLGNFLKGRRDAVL